MMFRHLMVQTPSGIALMSTALRLRPRRVIGSSSRVCDMRLGKPLICASKLSFTAKAESLSAKRLGGTRIVTYTKMEVQSYR